MSRRIDIELTSTKETTWTWRAAGARQPKGEVETSLLYEGAKVGDVVKAEAEFHLDGIELTEVFAPKAKKGRADLLEMKVRPLRDDEKVTTKLKKSKRDRNDRSGGRRKGSDRSSNKPKSRAESKPRPKRLRPKRLHRDALLNEAAPEHKPIIEQVMKDGIPGVRDAIKKQNEAAKKDGKPEVDPAPLLDIAEKYVQKARLAEWRDKADAAMAISSEIDLKDLRPVVVSGANIARDDESKKLADELKTVLDNRIESDHAAWVKDLETCLSEGRTVAALRISSRPVRAGSPLPAELATQLVNQSVEGLTAETTQSRWSTVLDALAFSPVRTAVKPTSLPAEPNAELIATVRRLSDKIPEIAALFGIDPASVPKSEKRRMRPDRKKRSQKKPTAAKKAGDKKPENKAASKPENKGEAIQTQKPVSGPAAKPEATKTASKPEAKEDPQPAVDAEQTSEGSETKSNVEATSAASEKPADSTSEPATSTQEADTADKESVEPSADTGSEYGFITEPSSAT